MTLDFQLDAVGNLHTQKLFLDFYHLSQHSACCDNLVTHRKVSNQLFVLFLTLVLRPNQQKIKNGKNQHEWQ